jgi:hydroxymethylpyrimidine pyrophosphatase-like HAD family hydrolase
VCNCCDLTEDQVFVAYDTANDIEMIRTPPRAIFVRNFDDELDGLPEICSRTAVPE